MGINLSFLQGAGLRARAWRGTAFTMLHIAGSKLLRLGSNVVLTRLLFPEAFGIMALASTFMQGLKLVSDTGVVQSIVRSDRGDDPAFLNTAWCVQILRGLLLWGITFLIAGPLARFYEEPILQQLLPVVGFSIFILGFRTTNASTARRHLILGRLVSIELGTQIVGIVIMIALAWWWQTVWALVIGGLAGTIVTVIAQHIWLPGIRNKPEWNREAFHEIFSFGKFIFLSSTMGFLLNNADKLILGAYLSMADFGVFNIGFMLATLPFMVGKAINNTIVFPLYRQRPIKESAENRRKVLGARRLVTAASVGMLVALAFIGIPVVDFLYDDRYALAGPVVVLMCFASVPLVVVESYRSVFMAAGDSRSNFILVFVGAILQVALLLAGVAWLGTFGAILAPTVTNILLMPLRVYLLRPHQGWDPLADAVLNTSGFALTGLACWLYWDQVVLLIN